MIDPLAYVTATAPAVGLTLSDDRLKDIAKAFSLICRIGAPALEFPVPADAEPAPVFTP